MELSFKYKKLEKTLSTDKDLAKHFGKLAKKIKQRLIQLESAENLEVISKLPALRLHQHQGKGKGTWTVDIQENWRLLFSIVHDPIPTLEIGGIDLKSVTEICIVSISDPH